MSVCGRYTIEVTCLGDRHESRAFWGARLTTELDDGLSVWLDCDGRPIAADSLRYGYAMIPEGTLAEAKEAAQAHADRAHARSKRDGP